MNLFTRVSMMMCLALCSTLVWAQEPASAPTVGEVEQALIVQMEKDELITSKTAQEALATYVTPEDFKRVAQGPAVDSTGSWADYVSLTNFIKVTALIILLVAFSGWIKLLASSLWRWIVAVPPAVWQGVLLSGSLLGTFFPEALWASQRFYVLFFSALANLVILAWVGQVYGHRFTWFKAWLERFKIPVSSVVSGALMVYFGALALQESSKLLGFLAVMSLSSMLSFTIFYYPGVLILNFREKWINTVIVGHLMVLLGWVGVVHTQAWPMGIEVFNAGVQFYVTLALAIALLVATSPFYEKRDVFGYLVLFTLLSALGVVGYFMSVFATAAVILWVCYVLMAIEWIGYWGYRQSWALALTLIGGCLYGVGWALERWGHLFYSALKMALG